MEQLELFISVAGTSLGLLLTTLTFLIKSIRNAKAKKKAQQMVEICNAILPYIEQAETFLHYSGQEKKEFVLTKANQFAIEQGMDFNPETIGEKIEELVNLTKEVNKRDKDKMTANSRLPETFRIQR